MNARAQYVRIRMRIMYVCLASNQPRGYAGGDQSDGAERRFSRAPLHPSARKSAVTTIWRPCASICLCLLRWQVSEQRLVCLHRSAENGTSNIPVSAGGVPSAPPPVASAEQRNSDATFHVFQMSVPLLLLLLLGCRDLPAAPESEACSVAKGTAFA